MNTLAMDSTRVRIAIEHGVALVCLVVMALVIGACGGRGAANGGGASSDPACKPLPPVTAPDFQSHLTPFIQHSCYQKQNWKRDAQIRNSDGVHSFVRVWYSPSLFNWMTAKKRQGPVPDGAIAVKEEHASAGAPIHLWTVMVKSAALSWDGWYWAVVYPEADSQAVPAGDGCAEAVETFTGAGKSCLNCHASAIDHQGTFVSTDYLNAKTPRVVGSVSPSLLDAESDARGTRQRCLGSDYDSSPSA